MRRNRKRKILPWAVGIVWFMIVGAVVAFTAVASGENSSLENELRMARNEGIPVEAEQLRTSPMPADQNAAVPIQQAMDLTDGAMKADAEQFDGYGMLAGGVPAKDLRSMDGPLAGVEPTVALFKKAADLGRIDFHRQWEAGPNLAMPEYKVFREGVRILIVDGDRMLRQGRVDEAYARFADAARLASLPAQEPTLVGYFVTLSGYSAVETELERAIWRLGPTPGIYRRTQQVIQAMGPIPSMRHALTGEVVMCRLEIQAIGTANPNSRDDSETNLPKSPVLRVKFVRDGVDAMSVAYWRQVFRALPADSSQTMATYDAMAKVAAESQRDNGVFSPFRDLVCPDFSGAAKILVADQAHRRTLLGLAMLLERRARHDRDESLAALGQDSLDPFLGKPLQVKPRAKGGVAVYSVGRDGKDNGGQRPIPGRGFDGADIVSEYPMPVDLHIKDHQMPRVITMGLHGAAAS